MHIRNRYSKYTFWLVLLRLHLGASEDGLHREKRQLLWPNTTLLQFNAGVGTPTPVKTIQVNWAFQANFQLPWNRTQIPGDIFFANTGYTGDSKKRRDIKEILKKRYESDAKLFHLYKYVEDILHSFGHNGTTCVLQTLCQLGREPLHSDDEENLLHDLASFVLNPNHDKEEESSVVSESVPYIEAFDRGARNEQCSYDCGISLVDMFTKVYLN